MKKTFTKLWSWMLLTAVFGSVLGINSVSAQTYIYSGGITINDAVPATPFPANIEVTGGPTQIALITVSINGLTHTFPADLDLMLVAPNGDNLVFMSDAGGSFDVNNVTFSISDLGAGLIPNTQIIGGSTYQPTNYGTGDVFAGYPGTPVDAATAGTGTFSSQFGGDDANGTWSLYLVDDAGADIGTASGWSITFFSIGPGCTDPNACNYNPGASPDDGSCEYSSCVGCTNPLACNYVPTATQDNGTCLFPGCTDPLANNYDPFAGCEDGSCCYATQVTIDMTDAFGDGWNGDNMTITDLSTNTVIATVTLETGASGQMVLCIPDGCYKLDVSGNFFPTEIGWTLTGAQQGPITGGAPVSNIYFAIGATSVCVPGCTDPTATNYDPAATIDNQSCLFCGANEVQLIFAMQDTFGDGWNGAIYTIADSSGATVATGSLNTADVGDITADGYDSFCLATGCYTVSITGGSVFTNDEISWAVKTAQGDTIVAYSAPNGAVTNIGFPWNGAQGCVFPGCTNPTCFNYNQFANLDDGSCLCPPANDDCANAIPIECGTPISGSLAYAAADPTATSCNGIGVNTPGIWYSILGTGQQITITTCPSGWDTRLHIYSGSCDNLSCVTANDDSPGCATTGLASTVAFTSVQDTMYYVFVSKFSNFNTNNNITLEITCQDCPGGPITNDDCATSIALSDSLTVGGSLCCSNQDNITAVSPFQSGYGVWFTANSGSFGTFDYNLVNGDSTGVDANDGANVGMIIYVDNSGTGCGGLTFVDNCFPSVNGCSGSLYSGGNAIVPNANYYFLVYTTNAVTCGNFALTVDFSYVGCTDPAADNYDPQATVENGSCTYSNAPANNLCADAFDLPCGSSLTGTTGGSTADGAPGVCNLGSDNGVWYTFNGDGQFHTISTCGSAIDTRIEVVTSDAGCGGVFTCVISNDNSTVCGPGSNDSQVQFYAESGIVYYVYITGGGVDTNGDFVNDLFDGPFNIQHTCEPAILGCQDACACNYNPAANVDDNSCDYFSCASCGAGQTAYQLRMTDTFGDGWNGNTYTLTTLGGDTIATGSLDSAQCVVAGGFGNAASGYDILCLADGCYSMTVGGGFFITEVEWTLLDASGNVLATDADGGTIDFTIGVSNCGCTDPTACNFDANALYDDGSCEYVSCARCTDPTACNYDPTALQSDPTQCCYSNCLTLMMYSDIAGGGWDGNTAVITDLGSGLVLGTATLDAGVDMDSAVFCAPSGCYRITLSGGTTTSGIFWTLTGGNGGPISGAVSAGGVAFSVGTGDCTPGCTEPVACNYNPSALISDCTLCEYTSCQGCTYPTAVNYNPDAGIDDGTCTFTGGGGDPTCPADINGDHVVNVTDLSLLLASYGLICP
jgi:subtilisin-like proprotein convertase family protein